MYAFVIYMTRDILILMFLMLAVAACIWKGTVNEAACDAMHRGLRPFDKQLILDRVLTLEECQNFVREAERHAEENGGWTKTRHEHHPTTDIDTADIKSVKFKVENVVYRRLVPPIATAFELDPDLIGIREVFIAKYAHDDQKSLEKHVDDSDISFVIPLNASFVGGGTQFDATKRVFFPDPGSALCFCGHREHEGMAVRSGTRYIMAGFLKYGDPKGCSTSDSESDSDGEDD